MTDSLPNEPPVEQAPTGATVTSLMSRWPLVRGVGSHTIHTPTSGAGAETAAHASIERPSAGPQSDLDMTAVTREEHDAKLQALEYKIDGRIGRLETLLETAVSGIARIETTFERQTDKLEQRMEDNRKHTTNVGWAIFGGVVAVIALAATVYQTGLTGRQVIGAQSPPAISQPAGASAQPPPPGRH